MQDAFKPAAWMQLTAKGLQSPSARLIGHRSLMGHSGVSALPGPVLCTHRPRPSSSPKSLSPPALSKPIPLLPAHRCPEACRVRGVRAWPPTPASLSTGFLPALVDLGVQARGTTGAPGQRGTYSETCGLWRAGGTAPSAGGLGGSRFW